MKRLLTLEDLYNYYSSNSKSVHFCSSKLDESIVVQVPGSINFEETSDDTEGLLKVTLSACHTNTNLNGSHIEKEQMEKSLPSFFNRPILGYIHYIDGVPNFYSHNFHEDENGEIVYDEVPVGIIPESCNAHLVYDDEADVYRVIVDGYIFEEYSKAAEILKREEKCDVSVELAIRELSYNAEEHYLNIDDFYFSGITILGFDEDGKKVNPGMAGSNIQLADFSKENNSMFSENEKLIEALNRLNETMSMFNIKNSEKGGNALMDNEEIKIVEEVEEETIVENSEIEIQEEIEVKAETEIIEEEAEIVAESEEEVEVEAEEEVEEKFVKSFELSHDDTRYALYQLLASVENSDNDYYYIVNVYDNYFVYQSWTNNRYFGQNYLKDDANVSFDGERYELFSVMLTESEKVALDDMRANYASISEKLAKYESEPNKMDILNASDYAYVAETEEFIDLMKQENHFDLTVDEVKAKADQILLDYAKKQSFSIKATENQKMVNAKPLLKANKKPSRYGDLFK